MLKKSITEFEIVHDITYDNTEVIQLAIEYCALHNYVLHFDGNTYLCNTLYIPKNSYIDFNGTTILCIGHHFMRNFRGEEVFTKYNGNGNIVIRNLKIIGGHVASFIHGKNILFDSIIAQEPDCDHYFEICACKDVIIKNCTFFGTQEKVRKRQMVEMIQIDLCTKDAFPWFINKDSLTYDGTVNQNILIDGCNFDKGLGTYQQIYTAIGVHSADTQFHKNIIISNCIIKNASYAAIHGICWDYVKVVNNTFVNSKDSLFHNCTNVKFINNKYL